MQFKIVNFKYSWTATHAYAIKYKKRWWHPWRFVKDACGRVTDWNTVKGAETYIKLETERIQEEAQEKLRKRKLLKSK